MTEVSPLPESLATNVALNGEETAPPFTGDVIVATGATESTVKLTTADPVPCGFVALTWTVCAPWASVGVVNGDVHGAAAPASIEQVMLVGDPPAEKVIVGVVSFVKVPFAGEVMNSSTGGATL